MFPLVSSLRRTPTNVVRTLRPTALVVVCFFILISVGTFLLMLPISSANTAMTSGSRTVGDSTSFLDALFTATSASCLTGLITVDTATHWSGFGQGVIAMLIQLGGLGFMTLASIFGLFVAGRMGLKRRESASAEGRGVYLGEVSWVVRATITFTLLTEAIVAIFLTVRFATEYDYPLKRAVWEGIFHAISGFNNAGFALYTDNVMSFNTDAWVLLPLAFALIVGGLGFPVLLEAWRIVKQRYGANVPILKKCRKPGHFSYVRTLFTGQSNPDFSAFLEEKWRKRTKRLSLTSKFTFKGTIALIVVGTIMIGAAEWNGAMRGLSVGTKLLNAFFAGVSPRTAGFNALDYADFHPASLLATDILMFIGGGSGGTAGGVKITTAAVILAAVVAEIRGDKSVAVSERLISSRVVRQALAVLAFGMGLVMIAVLIIMFLAPQFTTDQILFEVVSAFATVGLSTGITSSLPALAQFILIVLMFAGRVGPIVLATALAARSSVRMFEYPEERPTIG